MIANNQKQPALRRSTIITLVNMGIALVLLIFIYYIFENSPNQRFEPVIISTGEWAPYSGENLASYGIASAIVTKVFHDMGYVPQYQFLPWPAAVEKAAESESNDGVRGTFPFTENKGRESKFYFSDVILSINFAIFYNSKYNPEGADIRDTSDIAQHGMIPLAGYEYPEVLRKHLIPAPNTDTTDNLEAFMQLGSRKDAKLIVVESVEVGTQLLEQKLPHLAAQIKRAPFQGALHFRIMFSKRNPNNLTLKNEFDKQLAEFKSNKSAYRSFQKEILKKIEMSRAVFLEPYDKNQMVQAFLDTMKKEHVYLPKGSKALVKSWSGQFLQHHDKQAEVNDTLVKVKLLNGPLSLRDSVLYVDSKVIRLP
jgi:polar amino acid transport system substrate-binding protein